MPSVVGGRYYWGMRQAVVMQAGWSAWWLVMGRGGHRLPDGGGAGGPWNGMVDAAWQKGPSVGSDKRW